MADRIETLRRSERELLASVSHELADSARAHPGSPRACRGGLSRCGTPLHDRDCERPDGARDTPGRHHPRGSSRSDRADQQRLSSAVRAPVAVQSFFKSIVRRFTELHPDRPVTHQITCAGDIFLQADKSLLKRAVDNVLENAHKYSLPNRRSKCVPSTPQRQARYRSSCMTMASVSMPKNLPHVFAPFFRGDRSRARQTGGTGLGLTLAQRIVEAHGGTIRVQSQPEQGTTVTITLPVSASAAVAAPPGWSPA